jgi:hypothetical protein
MGKNLGKAPCFGREWMVSDGFGWFLYPDHPQFLKIQEMAWMVSVSK